MAMRSAMIALVTMASVGLIPSEALACPICFGGDPDSQVVQSMNWAVVTMLGVTGGVLSGFVGFIFHLIKRSRQALGQDHDQD